MCFPRSSFKSKKRIVCPQIDLTVGCPQEISHKEVVFLKT